MRATSLFARCLRLAIVALALSPVVLTRAGAQTCSADSQCHGGQMRAECVGDTLVVRRPICSGTCQVLEVSRQDCRIGGAGALRCVGGGMETMSGRCDALLGRCVQRREIIPCLPSCSCRGRVLTVTTGECSPAIGCHRATKVCPNACSCRPEPACE